MNALVRNPARWNCTADSLRPRARRRGSACAIPTTRRSARGSSVFRTVRGCTELSGTSTFQCFLQTNMRSLELDEQRHTDAAAADDADWARRSYTSSPTRVVVVGPQAPPVASGSVFSTHSARRSSHSMLAWVSSSVLQRGPSRCRVCLGVLQALMTVVKLGALAAAPSVYVHEAGPSMYLVELSPDRSK